MNWKRFGVVLVKAVVGVVLLLLGFEHPRVTIGVLVSAFIALYVANFVLNSVHYVVWNNFKPRMVSYQRLDRAPKFVIPKNSLLGQAISLVLQSLGYGVLLMLLFDGIAAGIVVLLGK